MDDYLEIDLRKIIKNLLKKWYWIVLPAALIGIAVFVFSNLTLIDIYQANASLIITDPINPIINPPKPSASTVEKIALSDKTILELKNYWECDDKEDKICNNLRGVLSIEASDDERIYTLSVKYEDAEKAARLANAWAGLVAQILNADFYSYDEGLIEQLGSQLSTLKLQLDQAEAAMNDFILYDERALLTDRLNSVRVDQLQTFSKQQRLKGTKFDAQGMLAQLENEADNERVDESFRISYLILRAKLYSGESGILLDTALDSNYLSSVKLQTEVELNLLSVSEFRLMLENWIAVIDNQITQLESQEGTYLSTINQLESEIRALNYQEFMLDADVTTFRETYQNLLRRYEEISITMGDEMAAYVKLLSPAPVPEVQLPQHTSRNTTIAFFIGGLLGLGGILVVDWWKTEDAPLEREE